MPEVGERVYAVTDHMSDDGSQIRQGEAGVVVGTTGDGRVVVSWIFGHYSTLVRGEWAS